MIELKPKIKKIYLAIFIAIILFKLLLMSLPGYLSDLALFQKWGNFLINHSPLEIYQKTECNMPPFWVYLSWIFTKINFLLTSQPLVINSGILKLPAVLADIGIGLIIFFFLIKKGLNEKKALGASLLFLLNPFVLFNSSVWGQFDSIYVFFALLAFIFLDRRRIIWASLFLALSFLTKLQGIIFLPLFLFLLLNKYSWKKIFLTIVTYLTTIIFTILPFLLAGNKLSFLIEKTWVISSKLLPYLSVNAFNLWWPIQVMVSPAKISYLSENISFLGPITFKIVGFILFFLFYFFIFSKREKNIFFLASLVALLFFMIPTAMHERYIFPFFAFFPIAWAMAWPRNKEYLGIYLILSFTSLLNLIFAFSASHSYLLTLLWVLSIFLSLLNLFIFFYLFFILSKNKKNA